MRPQSRLNKKMEMIEENKKRKDLQIAKAKQAKDDAKYQEEIIPSFGNLKENTPSSVVSHQMFDKTIQGHVEYEGPFDLDKLYLKVEWEANIDGSIPTATFYAYQSLKKHCPVIVLNYLEKRMKLDWHKLMSERGGVYML